jgi:two-component system cell cycle response regulator DivK
LVRQETGVAIPRPAAFRPLVLLVQQNSDDLEMYAEFLRYRRFQPIIALTMSEALAIAPTVDVIVTGITLPSGAHGLDFIEQVRRQPGSATTPIIVLTATLLDPEQQRAVEAVCDGFLRKPCLPGMLVREVRRVLAAAKFREATHHSAAERPPRKAGSRKLRSGSRRH